MFEKSCGAIVFDDDNVLLIKQTAGHISFPKGHVEANETEEETAIREVFEETNIKIEINNNYRYITEYSPKENVQKTVVYFLGKRIGGEKRPQEGEVESVFWINKDKVPEYLSHDNIIQIYNELLNDLNEKKESTW